MIQNSICWVGGGDEHHFQEEKFLNCSYSLSVVSWNRASSDVLVAIPKDPRALSMLQAGHTSLLQGQEWQLVPWHFGRGGDAVSSTSG